MKTNAKKLLTRVFSIILLLSVLTTIMPLTVNASKIGDVVDYVLYTDIVTYIDNQPIQSYNINGHTAIVIEDLAQYHFNVIWDDSARMLSASGPILNEPEVKPSFAPDNFNKNTIGKRAAPVLHTDIICFFDGKQIDSFNIGGKTIVYVDELAKIYADSYIWDATARSLNLDLVKPWFSTIYNPKYDVKATELLKGFTLTLENCSKNGMVDFTFTDYSGEYAIINSVDVSDRELGFGIYRGVESFGDFYKFFAESVNIKGGVRIANDTIDRRQALSAVFRVYINDELVSGELAGRSGNNYGYHHFIFDKRVNPTKIETIRVELGY